MHLLLLIAGIPSAIANPLGEYLWAFDNLPAGIRLALDRFFISDGLLSQSEPDLLFAEQPLTCDDSSQSPTFNSVCGVLIADADSFQCSSSTAVCCQDINNSPNSETKGCQDYEYLLSYQVLIAIN